MSAGPGRVDAGTLTAWLQHPAATTVIDVRSSGEFEAAHVAGSYNVPLDLLGEHAAEFAARLDRRVVLVCASGARADAARRHLTAAGAVDLHVLDGRVSAVEVAGGGVVHGAGRWAMERQVRLAAGSIVLTATLVSLVLPKARFVAGGIGAGLTASALTGTCPMAGLLAKLPHNRGSRRTDLAEVLAGLPTTGP